MNLPTPDPAFHWTPEAWGHALRCRPLEAAAQHLFTTRQLALRGGPDGHHREWAKAAASAGVGLDRVMRVRQVHGNGVRVLPRGAVAAGAAAERPDADALVTGAPGLALAVMVADCVPILLADPRSGVVAAVHAGWRGTCARVGPAAVRAMVDAAEKVPGTIPGKVPGTFIAAIGPSIGPCCYEVGETVRAAFAAAGHAAADLERWFVTVNGSLRLDLWQANRDLLVAAGVAPDRIFACGLCTQTHADVFDSYRVDAARAGRMAALVVAPTAPGA